jgi:hypothetical protein
MRYRDQANLQSCTYLLVPAMQHAMHIQLFKDAAGCSEMNILRVFAPLADMLALMRV